MKKLFCFVAFLFALTSMAIAQLNVISGVETRSEKIKVLQFQYSWMYKTSNGYQIWAKSDNRSDWHYNTIQLGETPEQCLQTLTDLYNMIENQVVALEVQQNDDTLFITTRSQPGIKMAWFRVGVNAGRSRVSKNQVLSLIDYFKSMAIAQFNVETRPEKIKVLQFQYSWMYKTSNGYQIWAKSYNRFDWHYNTIQLGETPEQCLQTLTDLYNIIENQVDTLEVQQNDDKLFITTCSQLGTKMAWFRVGVNAGRSRVSKNNVLPLINYFNSMISEETLKTDPQDTIVQVSATVQLE